MRRRGFSLLELLVAIALLGLLSGAVFAFMWNLFDRETRALDMAGRTQTGAILFDRLERDLMTAVAATAEGPGFTGGKESLEFAHRGLLIDPARSPHADLQRTSVRFEPGRGRLILERVDPDAGGASEGDGSDSEVDEFGGAGPLSEGEPAEDAGVLSERVRSVRFRYHDGRAWRSSFTSTRGLPAAVEVAVWFSRGEDDRGAEEEDTLVAPGEGFDPAEEFGAEFDFDPGMLGPPEGEDAGPSGAPDRIRVIAIPDAMLPEAAPRGRGRS